MGVENKVLLLAVDIILENIEEKNIPGLMFMYGAETEEELLEHLYQLTANKINDLINEELPFVQIVGAELGIMNKQNHNTNSNTDNDTEDADDKHKFNIKEDLQNKQGQHKKENNKLKLINLNDVEKEKEESALEKDWDFYEKTISKMIDALSELDILDSELASPLFYVNGSEKTINDLKELSGYKVENINNRDDIKEKFEKENIKIGNEEMVLSFFEEKNDGELSDEKLILVI